MNTKIWAIKWILLSRTGETNPFFDTLVEKKSCVTRERHKFYSCCCYTRFTQTSTFTLVKKFFFL